MKNEGMKKQGRVWKEWDLRDWRIKLIIKT